MKAGGWASIVVVYIMGVLAVSSLVVMLPLQADFVGKLNYSVTQYGLLLSVIGLSAAALATFCGGLVDRWGERTMLITSAVIGIMPNLAYATVSDIRILLPLRILEGFALSITLAAGPALIMRTTSQKRQIAAMTFWSTATPTAISVGMLLGGFYAGTVSWRQAFLMFAVALAAAAVLATFLPRLDSVRVKGDPFVAQIRAMLIGYRQTGAVKLGIALLLTASVSLGLNSILPVYLSQTHAISIASAASLIAGANLTMVAGAALLAVLVARGMAPRHVVAALAVGAVAFAGLVVWPATAVGSVAFAFAGWSFVVGAAQAAIFAVLPRIVDPTSPGLATGVLNQLASLSSFIAPLTFLAVLPFGWVSVVVLIAACWIVAATSVWSVDRR